MKKALGYHLALKCGEQAPHIEPYRYFYVPVYCGVIQILIAILHCPIQRSLRNSNKIQILKSEFFTKWPMLQVYCWCVRHTSQRFKFGHLVTRAPLQFRTQIPSHPRRPWCNTNPTHLESFACHSSPSLAMKNGPEVLLRMHQAGGME